ncbi:hypothetical protein P691DRAFT_787543 [Macrolepiota fuliginosa MF-IS2]|uniref:Uncharacterized protein n=1 Tax=Macrolepiota fuliginosa MF-IS2 TaxID=1400762 RepID=A0A9P5X5X2_9AGAR|nr:hypothetical protein P691DRAFT_787543 [Macrolepiota fuliginosa MF-IS2]
MRQGDKNRHWDGEPQINLTELAPVNGQVLGSPFREIRQHWGTVSSNLILTSEMDYLTSTIIDSVIKGMKIQTSVAPGFPKFTCRMTGIPCAYAIMVFPPELGLTSWIQVAPDFMHYIDHEELSGGTLNFLSMSADVNGITKLEALRKLAGEMGQCYQRGSSLLRSSPGA